MGYLIIYLICICTSLHLQETQASTWDKSGKGVSTVLVKLDCGIGNTDYDCVEGQIHPNLKTEPKLWRSESIQRVHYHDGRHDHSPVLHRWAVIGESIFILDQHKFVYVVPVTDLRETEGGKKRERMSDKRKKLSINQSL